MDKGVLPIAKWLRWEVPKTGRAFFAAHFQFGGDRPNAAKMQSPQPEGLTPSSGFCWREFLVFIWLIPCFDSDRAIV
ncbi:MULTISPECIES: hypothetical protein [unclassified Microcoleus]|uniref:hypothetical protein n=1 Tax=unclassified Microcoleus TaxID=2642155 RepID=UPI002FD07FE8